MRVLWAFHRDEPIGGAVGPRSLPQHDVSSRGRSPSTSCNVLTKTPPGPRRRPASGSWGIRRWSRPLRGHALLVSGVPQSGVFEEASSHSGKWRFRRGCDIGGMGCGVGLIRWNWRKVDLQTVGFCVWEDGVDVGNIFGCARRVIS